LPFIYVHDIIAIDLKRRGDCGKDCLNCGLFRTHCPGCITRICLIAKCKPRISYNGITHPSEFYGLREHCNSLNAISDDITQKGYYKISTSRLIVKNSIRSEGCRCAAYRGRVAHQLKDDVRSLALHNLLQTVGRFG